MKTFREKSKIGFQQVHRKKSLSPILSKRATFVGIGEKLLISVKFQKKLFIVLDSGEPESRTPVSKTAETFRLFYKSCEIYEDYTPKSIKIKHFIRE